MNYAKQHGVQEVNKSDIEYIREVERSNSSLNRNGRAIVVTFGSVRARNLFTDAKHNAIKERKALLHEMNSVDKSDSVSIANIEKRIAEIKSIKISEDLTMTRLKLLNFVRSLETVKDAYTRDGVVHAVTTKGKEKIFSAVDLQKLGVQKIPLSQLGIPKTLQDVASGSPKVDE